MKNTQWLSAISLAVTVSMVSMAFAVSLALAQNDSPKPVKKDRRHALRSQDSVVPGLA